MKPFRLWIYWSLTEGLRDIFHDSPVPKSQVACCGGSEVGERRETPDCSFMAWKIRVWYNKQPS